MDIRLGITASPSRLVKRAPCGCCRGISEAGGAERLAPPGWLVSAATFIGEEPALGVLPIGTGGGGKRPKELPLVVSFDGKAWSTLVGNAFKPKALNGRNPMDVLHAEHTVILLADSQRKLWVVWPYTYTVRRYTPSGRVASELTVGKGEARYHDNQEELAARFEKEMERKGYDSKSLTGAPFTGIKAFEAAAFGRDGNLYLLVSPEAAGGKRALDRFNQATLQLERIAPTLDADVEMVGGKSGLYFAAKEGKGGRWLLPWESLGGCSVEGSSRSEDER